MHSTKIITTFVRNDEKFLILKRSKDVRSMKGMWAGISGIMEGDEEPLERAKIEIFEEAGITENRLTLVKSADKMMVSSPQHEGHQWVIFPFLFEAEDRQVRLNWENSEYRWILKNELGQYRTVPSLEKVLLSLL